VAGHVLKVYVSDNQDVKAGDLLVELDPQTYQAAVDQAKGRVAAAEADLLAARSQVEQAKAQVAAARAAMAQAQADLTAQTARQDEAQENLAQYRKARATGVVSSLEWTKIETQARTSSANVDASAKAVTAAEAQVSQAAATLKAQQSRVGVATAQIETAKAALESANLDLGYTKVVAAEDGRVTRKNVEAGNFVSPGTPMMALVSPDVWVTANFKETQLAHMKPGQKVDIEVDSYPGVKFTGHVDSVQQGSGARFSLLPPENATGNYVKVVQRVPVKIDFDGPRDGQHLLGPGMSVEPSVRIEN
jgi:membrane fusion protein (multidrug efflux system)